MEFAKTILVRPTANGFIQLFRYGGVAVIALAVDIGGLILLKEVFHFHYLLAATLSFCGGMVVNYILSKLWVFSEAKIANRTREFAIFAAIGVVGLMFNDLILWVFTSFVGFHYLGSKIIATGVVFFWNFFARKRLLF